MTTQTQVTFTAQQLRNFKSYERVRASNRFNMFDPRAKRATGLNDDEYTFVTNNFSELREAAQGAKK